MTTENLAVVVPVLRRPQNIFPFLESLGRHTPPVWNAYFVVDEDDAEELKQLRVAQSLAWGGRRSRVFVIRVEQGLYYSQKTNVGAEATEERLLFTGADDLRFTRGWYEAATAQIRPPIGVVGTNDLGSNRTASGRHSTHSLLTREYVNRGCTMDMGPGVVFYDYPHEWCDNELIGTAKARKVYAHASDSVVEHLHVDWKKAPMDETYELGASRRQESYQIFMTRRYLWMKP